MRLIGLAVVLTLSLTLSPLISKAQQAGKVYNIGYLGLSSSFTGPHRTAFSPPYRTRG
jgi:hypothetical protein